MCEIFRAEVVERCKVVTMERRFQRQNEKSRDQRIIEKEEKMGKGTSFVVQW